MNKQDKFVTRYATWFITPKGYVYLGSTIDGSENEWERRHERMKKDPDWNGFKFLRAPIAVPIPDAVVNEVIME